MIWWVAKMVRMILYHIIPQTATIVPQNDGTDFFRWKHTRMFHRFSIVWNLWRATLTNWMCWSWVLRGIVWRVSIIWRVITILRYGQSWVELFIWIQIRCIFKSSSVSISIKTFPRPTNRYQISIKLLKRSKIYYECDFEIESFKTYLFLRPDKFCCDWRSCFWWLSKCCWPNVCRLKLFGVERIGASLLKSLIESRDWKLEGRQATLSLPLNLSG